MSMEIPRDLFILGKYPQNFIYSRKIPTMHKIVLSEQTTTHKKTIQINPTMHKKIIWVPPDPPM